MMIWMLVLMSHRRKWDTRSKKDGFVGYEENIKGYRIYFPSQRKVEFKFSRNVIFKPSYQNPGSQDTGISKNGHSKHLIEEYNEIYEEDLTNDEEAENRFVNEEEEDIDLSQNLIDEVSGASHYESNTQNARPKKNS
ncbi:hypothetical protein AVEN_79960-1 [Araneus ventricosus]|uniref:Retroviral polymerase SH3-like domain-containing protein n=1 Tax=Araneus ventricosus TaxID=182803 RepID=A0A4Y2H6K6_ARAVE|nr:hypothetical protein AVEN_79960-1 [Araneus ventricosus]